MNIPAAAEGPPRLSPLHTTHERLGAGWVRLAGWLVPWGYRAPEEEAETLKKGAGVADISSCGKLQVRGNPAAELWGVEPPPPGRAAPILAGSGTGSTSGAGHLARLAWDEFFVVTPPGGEEPLARHVEEKRAAFDLFLTLVNQTSGLAGLALAGPAGRDVLAKLCALSLNAQDFPDRRVAQTSLARVHTILMSYDLGDVPAFELYFERSYAEYVWTALIDAGDEYGIVPFGWGARELLYTGRLPVPTLTSYSLEGDTLP